MGSATRLLRAIPARDLNALLGELAAALANRAGDLRTIVSASTTFSQEFLRYQRQFTALLANAPPVLDAVSAVGPQLTQALVNTEALARVLADRRYDLTAGLFRQGAAATGILDTLLTDQAPNLGCLAHDLSQLATNLDQPANLSNLSQALADNTMFFGAVGTAAVQGDAVGLRSGEPTNRHQYFLRTRLLLPPVSPSAMAYARQTGIPAVLPGAGCSTEFGQGAPAASQPGFQPAAGGSLVSAPASAAQVRGGGDPPPAPPARRAAYVGHPGAAAPLELAPLGAVLLPAFLLAWGARPARRRRRRRA